MRTGTEEEMMALILDFAKKDDRVRVVWMNGSRVNPNVPKDPFQDYDIIYLVTDVEPFSSDKDYVTSYFGETTILQIWPPKTDDDDFGYQFQFMAGKQLWALDAKNKRICIIENVQ